MTRIAIGPTHAAALVRKAAGPELGENLAADMLVSFYENSQVPVRRREAKRPCSVAASSISPCSEPSTPPLRPAWRPVSATR